MWFITESNLSIKNINEEMQIIYIQQYLHPSDGDLGVYGNVKDAYMKQKHRLIWERRHGKVGSGMKTNMDWDMEAASHQGSTNLPLLGRYFSSDGYAGSVAPSCLWIKVSSICYYHCKYVLPINQLIISFFISISYMICLAIKEELIHIFLWEY